MNFNLFVVSWPSDTWQTVWRFTFN